MGVNICSSAWLHAALTYEQYMTNISATLSQICGKICGKSVTKYDQAVKMANISSNASLPAPLHLENANQPKTPLCKTGVENST